MLLIISKNISKTVSLLLKLEKVCIKRFKYEFIGTNVGAEQFKTIRCSCIRIIGVGWMEE